MCLKSLKSNAVFVCFIGFLFCFYEFIQMNCINSISQPLLSEFQMTATQLGHVSALYFYASVLLLLPAAMILDRVSTKRIMLISLMICIVGTVSISYATHIYVLAICRFLTGIGSAFCFLSCIRLGAHWFPAQKMALVSGFVVTMLMLGGIVAQTPLSMLVHQYGWRHAMLYNGLFGVLIWLLIALLVSDYPSHKAELFAEQKLKVKQLGYWQSLKLSFFRRQNWLCGMYTNFVNLPICVLGGFMGSMYLIKVHGFDSIDASMVVAMLFFGTTVGSPVMGYVSDRLGMRRMPMQIGCLLSLSLMLIIIYWSTASFASELVLFFVLGFITSTQVISYPLVAESNVVALTATSVSVVSMSVISGGVVFQPVFGALMDWHWHGLLINGVRQYSAGDLQFAMWLFPVMFAVAQILTFFIKETHCQPQVKAEDF